MCHVKELVSLKLLYHAALIKTNKINDMMIKSKRIMLRMLSHVNYFVLLNYLSYREYNEEKFNQFS